MGQVEMVPPKDFVQTNAWMAHFKQIKANIMAGSGCGSVGRAVASNTRGPLFESSHWQNFIYILNICLLSIVCWKGKNKEKEAGYGPFFLKKS